MWSSTRSLGKTLNQPSLVSNFHFLGLYKTATYETNLSYVPVNKLQKYLKLGTQQFPTLNRLGFQVQKLIMTNLKVWQKNFLYPCLGFFYRNEPTSIATFPPEKIIGIVCYLRKPVWIMSQLLGKDQTSFEIEIQQAWVYGTLTAKARGPQIQQQFWFLVISNDFFISDCYAGCNASCFGDQQPLFDAQKLVPKFWWISKKITKPQFHKTVSIHMTATSKHCIF